jgi:hypothetical protein
MSNRLSYNRFTLYNKQIIQAPDTEFIGCIYCKEKYRNDKELYYDDDNTAYCHYCGIDTIVAWHLIPSDNGLEKLREWYEEGFKSRNY